MELYLESEIRFANRMKALGLTAVKNDRRFYLLNGSFYIPDFHIPELNLYVEVIKSPSAHSNNCAKYAEMVRRFPVNFALMSYDGDPVFPGVAKQMAVGLCVVNGCGRRATGPGLDYCYKHTDQLGRLGIVEPLDGEWKYRREPETKCKVPNCNRFKAIDGYCIAHYQWKRNNGGKEPTHLIRLKSPNGVRAE